MKTIFSTYKMAIGYGLLFLLAIILRFHQLGIPMLGEKEAAFALQAVNGSPSLFGGITGVSGLSAIISPILFLFGKSDVAARIIPALFGSFIILVPFLFRRVLGDKAAICLSILFMFDPSLTAYSRQVDGAIITVCGFLFAFGFVLNRKYSAAGIATGFALLGSPIIWPGLLAAGLAFWLTFLVQGKSTDDDEEPTSDLVFSRDNLIQGGIALILTIVLVGSTFLMNLSGIAAPVLNLTAYVQGWFRSSDVSIFMMLFSFILYQPFVFVTGIFEGLRTSRSGDRINSFLLRWFLFSILLAIFYPSRGMDALLFTYLPLLVLSARFIVRLIQSLEMPDIPAYGEMVLVILLLVFCWLNLLAIKFPIEGQEEALRAAAAGGAFLLLIIASILIRMGWPPKQAKTGLWMGLAVLIAIISFSTAWRSAGLGLHPEAELWNYEGVTDEMDLLKKTAGDLSEWMSRTINRADNTSNGKYVNSKASIPREG